MQSEKLSEGVYQNLVSSNQNCFREIALTYFGRRISYRSMFACVERCACACLRWGVKTGDSVLLCSAAVPELVYVLLGLWKLGAVPHMVHPSLSSEQLRSTVRDCNASLFFVLDQLLPHVQAVLQEKASCQTIVIPIAQSMPLLRRRRILKNLGTISTDIEIPRRIFWKEFMESGRCVCCAQTVNRSSGETALVLQEALSKYEVRNLPLSQEKLCSVMKQSGQSRQAWNRQERYLGMIPPWEREGITRGLLAPLSMGLTLVLQPQANADSFAETLLKEQPHHVLADQRIWSCAEQQPQLVGAELSFLKTAEIITDEWEQDEVNGLNRFLLSHQSPITLQQYEKDSSLRSIV